MQGQLERIAASLEQVVTALQPASLSGPTAVATLDQFERLARLAEAGRLAVLARIDQTRIWQDKGHPSAAHWAAERTGTTIGHAVNALATAKALTHLPETRRALRAGTISPQQTQEIASAAKANPASEQKLLDTAASKTTAELRAECQMVRAAAAGDSQQERIHRSRYLRHKIDEESASLLILRSTSDHVAPLLAYCKAEADRRDAAARRDGTILPYEAHLADALCALPTKINLNGAASASGKEPRAKDRAVRAVVYVHTELTAWDRGYAEPGERCEITGVGPTTIAAARRLAAEPGGMLKLAIHNHGNLTGVATLGRYIPARLDDALKARDPKCIVKGCTRSRGLERDHRTPFAQGGETSLANLSRPCSYHHDLKTHKGWRIVGEPPNCEIIPPDAPDPKPPP